MKVLDHGYLEKVEHWGSEENIISAARMSTGGSFRGWDTDEKLLKYLYTHKHFTPFEMCGLTIEVQAPIFVIREWQRHRTQSFNEASARYAPLPDVNYLPSVERLMMDPGKNGQAGAIKDAPKLDELHAVMFLADLEHLYAKAEEDYQIALGDGVPKELARLMLPSGRYTKMRVSANLRNWLAFLELRMAPNAQWEIQEYARGVASLIQGAFPRTYELFRASMNV